MRSGEGAGSWEPRPFTGTRLRASERDAMVSESDGSTTPGGLKSCDEAGVLWTCQAPLQRGDQCETIICPERGGIASAGGSTTSACS